MKIKFLAAIFFVAGILAAPAQSNPTSPDAVDTETEMTQPDGVAYVNSYYQNDTYSGYSIEFNWSETSGGAYQNIPVSGNIWPEPFDDVDNDVYEITDFSFWDAAIAGYTGTPVEMFYGSGSAVEEPGDESVSYSGQGQLKLMTGGSPGDTGYGLYELAGSAMPDPIVPTNPIEPINPVQITYNTFGSLGSNGVSWAVLPNNAQFDVTPQVRSSFPLNFAGVSGVTNYQLVSECVATTPTNQARTTIGVGEQVNLSFNPPLPVDAIWTTTAGSVNNGTNPFTQFTAPSNAADATVTATVQGHSISMTFNVVEPNGMVSAEIISTNSYSPGTVAAGMVDVVTAYPTNVSFYRVELIELQCMPTNITGYYTDVTFSPISEGSATLGYNNTFDDTVYSVLSNPSFPLYSGGYDVDVPVVWLVQGSSVTNNFATFASQIRLLDSSGDFSVAKYGITITRSTNNVSYSSQ